MLQFRGSRLGLVFLINLLVSKHDFENTTVKAALMDARDDYVDSLEHQYTSLAAIQKALHLGSEPLFNTGLSCFRETEAEPSSRSAVTVDPVFLGDMSEYDIALKATYGRSKITLAMAYSTTTLSPQAADVLGGVLVQILQSLPASLNQDISSMNLFDLVSRRHLRAWNDEIPKSRNICVHDILSYNAAIDPKQRSPLLDRRQPYVRPIRRILRSSSASFGYAWSRGGMRGAADV